MPTGYTQGILDGEIKTLPEFAQMCMRAFGATIHMREESLDKKYEPRKVSDYYTKALADALEKREKAIMVSDKEIIDLRKNKISEDKERIETRIKEIIKHKKLLDAMLDKVKAWIPPSDEYISFKNYMIEQLETTIEGDADVAYYEKELINIKKGLANIDATQIRKDMIDSANENIAYYTKELAKDTERCNSSNKWVEDLLQSLK